MVSLLIDNISVQENETTLIERKKEKKRKEKKRKERKKKKRKKEKRKEKKQNKFIIPFAFITFSSAAILDLMYPFAGVFG